jgi:hypothetical protein
MCDTCGCNVTDGNRHLLAGDGPLAHTADGRAAIDVLEGLLDANDHQAAHNRLAGPLRPVPLRFHRSRDRVAAAR